MVFGSGEYVWIKIDLRLFIGWERDFVVEKIKLGWFVLLLG